MLFTQEYAALKSEIQQCIGFEFVSQTTMITVVIAVVSLAFQQNNAWLFAISYLPLMYFQTVMNKKRNGRLKIAAYIQIFHEEDVHWEKAVYGVAKKVYANKPSSPLFHPMGFLSTKTAFTFSVLVAMCSSVHFFVINHLSIFDICSHKCFLISHFVPLLLLHFICVGIIYLLNCVHKSSDISALYISAFEEIKKEQQKTGQQNSNTVVPPS